MKKEVRLFGGMGANLSEILGCPIREKEKRSKMEMIVFWPPPPQKEGYHEKRMAKSRNEKFQQAMGGSESERGNRRGKKT